MEERREGRKERDEKGRKEQQKGKKIRKKKVRENQYTNVVMEGRSIFKRLFFFKDGVGSFRLG